MKIYISHNGSYDYEAGLYAPIKQSELSRQHEIFLPHDGNNIDIKTKDIIKDFDLMIAEVSYPSTGQGIEIGLATAANVPVVCLYKSGTKPSSALRFYTDAIIEYYTAEDLTERIDEYANRRNQ
jgi:hypothetical protein